MFIHVLFFSATISDIYNRDPAGYLLRVESPSFVTYAIANKDIPIQIVSYQEPISCGIDTHVDTSANTTILTASCLGPIVINPLCLHNLPTFSYQAQNSRSDLE